MRTKQYATKNRTKKPGGSADTEQNSEVNKHEITRRKSIMKTKEELNALKKEVETLNKKLAELTEDELKEMH